MNIFDRLNNETRDYNNRNIDRFNPSTRGNYSTSYNSNGYYSPNRNNDINRYNQSTKSNYKFFDPCNTYR